MLRIYVIDKGDLDLGDTSITMVSTNPVFTDSGFAEAFSYSFDIDATNYNLSLLEQSERLDNTKQYKKFKVRIYSHGIAFEDAYLTIQSMMNNTIKCSINNEDLNLRKGLEETRLRELDLETFDIYDDTLGLGSNVKRNAWTDHLNDWMELPSDEVNHSFPTIEANYGYDDTEPENAMSSVAGAFRYINICVDGQYRLDTASINLSGPNATTATIPLVKFLYVLEKAVSQFGYSRLIGDIVDLKDFKELSIFNHSSLDRLDPIERDSFGRFGMNTLEASYSLQNYLPDLAVSDMILAMKKLFGVIIIIDYNSFEIKTIKSFLDQSPEDLTSFASPDYSYNWLAPEGYKFTFTDLDDEKDDYSSEMTSVLVGSEENDFSTPHRPLRSNTLVTSYTNNGGLAYGNTTSGASYSDVQSMGVYHGVLKTPFNPNSPADELKKFILTFYRGKQLNSEGEAYPMCMDTESTKAFSSGTGFDIASQKLGDYSLQWDGENGLYNKFHKDWAEFLDGSKEITRNLYLPPHKIKDIIRWRNQLKTINGDKGNMRGVVKQITYILSNKGTGISSVIFIGK